MARLGEQNGRAIASDQVVCWARDKRELEGWTFGQIAQTLSERLGFPVWRGTVQRWCTYQRREITADQFNTPASSSNGSNHSNHRPRARS